MVNLLSLCALAALEHNNKKGFYTLCTNGIRQQDLELSFSIPCFIFLPFAGLVTALSALYCYTLSIEIWLQTAFWNSEICSLSSHGEMCTHKLHMSARRVVLRCAKYLLFITGSTKFAFYRGQFCAAQ